MIYKYIYYHKESEKREISREERRNDIYTNFHAFLIYEGYIYLEILNRIYENSKESKLVRKE